MAVCVNTLNTLWFLFLQLTATDSTLDFTQVPLFNVVVEL